MPIETTIKIKFNKNITNTKTADDLAKEIRDFIYEKDSGDTEFISKIEVVESRFIKDETK